MAVTVGVVLLVREPAKTYSPGEAVDGITSELHRDIPEDYPRVTFVDVTAAAGIDFRHFPAKRSTQLPEDMGSGAAWGDYDNDGDLDLYLCDIAHSLAQTSDAAAAGGNRLFQNNGDGTFRDVTAATGVGFQGLAMGAAWADYDNDGDLDLAVSAYRQLVLYRNRGDGSFEDATRFARLAGRDGFWAGLSWADYDRDGFADLYVCGYVQYDFKPEHETLSSRQYAQVIPFTLNPSSYKPQPNLLFRNNGDGTFRECARQAGVENTEGRSLSAAWSDFDQDGWPDLYVANDISDNAMYRNRGDGAFEDISHPAWVADYRGAMGLALGDFDRDGDSDIFVTHWMAQENGLYWNLLRSADGGSNTNPLKFSDIADMVGLGQISLQQIGWGTSFFDYDNDGLLDLFVANGSTFQRPDDPARLVSMPQHLFWQKGQGTGFFEVGRVSGEAFQHNHVGRGTALADYDNDGDIDVLLVNHQEPPLLLRNDGGNRQNWLKVRLHPTRGNRNGFGARIVVETEGVRQYHEVGTQPSYLSQNALEAHFGLGKAGMVRRVEVIFLDGVKRVAENVAANQTILIEE
jgi:hypothetical protein